MTLQEATEVVKMTPDVVPIPMDKWNGLWDFARDKTVDPSTRLDLLRPMVFTEWDLRVGRAEFAYEDILCELDDDDPRIDEFYKFIEGKWE